MKNTSHKLEGLTKSVKGVMGYLEAIPKLPENKRNQMISLVAKFLPSAMQIAQGFYAKDHPRV